MLNPAQSPWLTEGLNKLWECYTMHYVAMRVNKLLLNNNKDWETQKYILKILFIKFKTDNSTYVRNHGITIVTFGGISGLERGLRGFAAWWLSFSIWFLVTGVCSPYENSFSVQLTKCALFYMNVNTSIKKKTLWLMQWNQRQNRALLSAESKRVQQFNLSKIIQKFPLLKA